MRARDRRGASALGVEAIGVCLLWSIVNPAHELRVGELIAEHAARRPVHALAPAQPDRARVPARVLDGHRRLAEAADAGLPARAGARPARGRLRAGSSSSRPPSAAPGARPRSSSARSTPSAPGPSMAPVAALTYGGARAGRRRHAARHARLRHRRHDFDVGLVSDGDDPLHARDVARRPLDRPHHRHARGRREEHRRRRRLDRVDRLRRAAARRPAERGRRPRARPATAAAGPSRPSPTPRCCSATSTRRTSSAGA